MAMGPDSGPSPAARAVPSIDTVPGISYVQPRMKLFPRPVPVLALGLLGILAAAAPAQERPQPPVIRKITIRGLKRLSEPSVLAKMKIRIGQTYDPRAVSEEAGHLFRMGDFSQVLDPQVDLFEDGVEVIFTVKEKPRVTAVRFEVLDTPSGKPSISQSDLRSEISTKADGRLSDYAVKVDSDTIRRLYREKGYPFVEVKTALKDEAAGVSVTFIIEEGARVRIREIDFIGNRSIDSGTLQREMETRTKDFFFGLFHPGFYDESILATDISRLTNVYRGKGFFEARLAVDDLVFDRPMERMRILIRVEEGPRYTFRGYDFEGNKVFSTAVLAALTRAPIGQPYDEERMQEDRNELLKYYKDRAYISVRVDYQHHPSWEGTDVRVRFKIEEGNETYIEHIYIRSNEHTQDRVIRRELEFYPGEKVNFSKMEKSRSNLSRLQIFKDIRLSFEDTAPSRPGKKDVVVQIDEEPTGRLVLGFGVSSGFGLIGNFSILKRNFDITDLPDSIYEIQDSFTGAGQTMNIVIQPGTLRSLYQATFVEPYLFDTRNSLTLSGAIRTIIRDDYDEDRLSFQPRIGHAFDFDRDLVFTIGSRIEQVEISHIDPLAAPDVKEAKGFTSIIALNSGLTYDKVLHDRWEGPYEGHREMATFEYGGEPLGGEVDFYKAGSSLDLYYPIYVHQEDQLHHVIGLFSKFGIIEGHHSTESIPIFERFFLGGPYDVRGFLFRGLGPHFRGDALGGTTAWYGNLEYVFPLFQKYLRGVVFLDYGNLSPDFQEFVMDETRLAAGGGIRINFPFLGGAPLPIGFYFANAFRHESSDRLRFFLFTIGAPF